MSLPGADLCATCGMCCNGVLFDGIDLAPEDSRRSLAAHGLKVKHRISPDFVPQPCPAHTGSSCRIYHLRPSRCRKFVCRQLALLESGGISSASATETIRTARRLCDELAAVLHEAGDDRNHKPLLSRSRLVLNPPLTPAAVPHQKSIEELSDRLIQWLDSQFRVFP